MSFPGLKIKQNQRRVFQDGKEINLTRLKYSTLVFLASNSGIVLAQTQIFEAVWSMESNSCHSSVTNVIYNLRKKIGCLLFGKKNSGKSVINLPFFGLLQLFSFGVDKLEFIYSSIQEFFQMKYIPRIFHST